MKLNALLVIKTKNGYAVAPFSGEVPRDLVMDMEVASDLSSYSYSQDTVLASLKRYFEPQQDAPASAPVPTNTEGAF